MPFKHLKKTTKANSAAIATTAKRSTAATTAAAAAAAATTRPNNEKKLKLELPLTTDVYAAAPNVPRRAKRTARSRNAAQPAQPQLVRHTYPQATKLAAMPLAYRNPSAKRVGLPAATQQEQMKELLRMSNMVTGRTTSQDVRHHIEGQRTKLHSAPQLQLSPVDVVALKNARRKRAAEEAAQLKTTKANCTYFDRYLPSAFDLTTTEGMRKLEAHFFPGAHSNEQQIGDSLRTRRKSMSANAASGSASARPVKTVLQHAKLPDRPKSLEATRTAMQRLVKRKFGRATMSRCKIAHLRLCRE